MHWRSRGPGGATPTPEARGSSQGAVAVQAQEGLEELSHVEVRKGGGEEIPFIQGKEQWLHFAGPVTMAIIKKFTNNKFWRGCGEKGTLLHCWWECKLIQPL